ncbi:MAG: TetR/AcrR family transcriptional regulator [Balneolales bacterium]|nr:TetR/AcrR family transcriptional regulator [Balneolales bacterium]
MTEKQLNILQAALELFAKEGYNATSTSKVAKHAGVSEGLVFRHFENKAGLLDAILKEGEKRIKAVYADVVLETDPKEVIRKVIQIPFSIPKDELEFWKLQVKLKWELDYDSSKKMEPLQLALSNAFMKLGYSSPEREAQFLVLFMEGLSSAMLKGYIDDKTSLEAFLLDKYNL